MSLYNPYENREYIDRSKSLTKEDFDDIIYSYYKDRDEEYWIDELFENSYIKQSN